MSHPLESALADARYFGSEFQANPGSDKMEYLDSVAMKLGKELFRDLDPATRRSIRMAFAEGIAREKRHQ